jgi:hypothetical protein
MPMALWPAAQLGPPLPVGSPPHMPPLPPYPPPGITGTLESKFDALLVQLAKSNQESSSRFERLERQQQQQQHLPVAVLPLQQLSQVAVSTGQVTPPTVQSELGDDDDDAMSYSSSVDAVDEYVSQRRRGRHYSDSEVELSVSDDEVHSEAEQEVVHDASTDQQNGVPLRPGTDMNTLIAQGIQAHLQQMQPAQGGFNPATFTAAVAAIQSLTHPVSQTPQQSVSSDRVQDFRPPPPVVRTVLSPSTGLPRQVQAAALLKQTGSSYRIPRKGRSSSHTPSPKRDHSHRSRSPREKSSTGPVDRRTTRQSDPRSDARMSRQPSKPLVAVTPSPSGSLLSRRSRSLSPHHGSQAPDLDRSRSQPRPSVLREDDAPASSENEPGVKSFRDTVRLLLAAVPELQAATEPGPQTYPKGMSQQQTGKSTKPVVLLPPHPSIQTWYEFAEESLKDAVSKKGTPFNCPSIRRTTGLYNSGEEGAFLLGPKLPPDNFKDLSNFSQAEHVTKQLTNPLTLSSGLAKAVDKSVRVGIGAASYASHFLDGADLAIADILEKVNSLSAPPESSSTSRQAVDNQKEA